MKKLITPFLAVGLIGAGFAVQTTAQSVKEDKRESREVAAASSIYVISAKAGAVNYVSGKVAIDRKNGKAGYLTKGDKVEKGERVRTGSDGKAEILLNPGSYVRLSENANFRFGSTSLDDLRIALTSGSAIFEIITDDGFNVVVGTPKSSFQLLKTGVYRIDALADGTGKISVWKGKARYGIEKNDVVKGGQTTAVVNGQVSVQKFDRDNKGEFETWSRDRAKEIARVNAKLQEKMMNRSLLSSFAQNGSGSWGSTNRFGLWIFDPFSSGYCFLPFGYGWSSPYGFGLPNRIYNNVNPNWNTTNQNQGNFPSYPNNGSGVPSMGNNPPSSSGGFPNPQAPIGSPRMPPAPSEGASRVSGGRESVPISDQRPNN